MFNQNLMRSVLLATSVIALGACTTLPVTTDYNPAAGGAGGCHNYAWAQERTRNAGQPAAFGNPLNAERLRAAIESNLAARGIQPAVDHTNADCVIGYAIGSRQVADEYAGLGFGMGYGWGGWGHRGFGGMAYDWPLVRNEGRISVDLFDAKSRRPIWHASVNQNVVDLTGPSAEARINAAAAAIFTKFPLGTAPPPMPPHTTT
jgi:Domain of unknown function (DUF4136)